MNWIPNSFRRRKLYDDLSHEIGVERGQLARRQQLVPLAAAGAVERDARVAVAGRVWKYAHREVARFWCAAVGARARTNRDGRLSR